MLGVMQALVKNKFTGSIYPEHPKAFDADRDRLAPGSRLPGYPGLEVTARRSYWAEPETTTGH